MFYFLDDFPTQPSYIFILNFYWTASVAFGVGFGDITANTRELMIYVVVVIVTCEQFAKHTFFFLFCFFIYNFFLIKNNLFLFIAYLYFQYITILIASYLTGINMNLTLFQKRMSHLVSYLKAENVEPLLRKHIINHFEYIWKKNKAMQVKGRRVYIRPRVKI